ncbi:MAG: hypothetical protein A2351_00570 [Omnitrophica bacterium RIFOXYB12_FULL_50_7]|nr:MAG: hypothetical protein A2351_00570 [Omnitrophica bacterium RIFOXYB12_FULL_50_7]
MEIGAVLVNHLRNEKKTRTGARVRRAERSGGMQLSLLLPATTPLHPAGAYQLETERESIGRWRKKRMSVGQLGNSNELLT